MIIAAHGVRTVENLRIHCGIEDPAEQEVRILVVLEVLRETYDRGTI